MDALDKTGEEQIGVAKSSSFRGVRPDTLTRHTTGAAPHNTRKKSYRKPKLQAGILRSSGAPLAPSTARAPQSQRCASGAQSEASQSLSRLSEENAYHAQTAQSNAGGRRSSNYVSHSGHKGFTTRSHVADHTAATQVSAPHQQECQASTS